MSIRGVVSVWVLKILYAVIGMLYRLATFQDLLLTIQVRFQLAKSTNFTLVSLWLYRKIGVLTSSQNLIHFAIRYHRENIWVIQLNIADSEKNIIVYYILRCGEGIELFGSSVMWAVWTKEEYLTKMKSNFDRLL